MFYQIKLRNKTEKLIIGLFIFIPKYWNVIDRNLRYGTYLKDKQITILENE